MAIRENTILLKRSDVPGKVPLAGDIQLGELALNIADVKLYASGTTENDIVQIGWDRISRTGDTVTGDFTFSGDVNATTISATTYYNLPVSGLTAGNNINVSGSSGNYTISVTGTTGGGGGDYLPLSGGTVTGGTVFTSGLTANTLNVNGLTQTSGITSTGGIIFPHKTITANYTATTSDYFLNITGGTFDVTLQSAVGVVGKLLVVKNEGVGIINVLSVSGQTIDDRTDVLLTKGNSLQIVSDGKNWVILGYNISSTQTNTGVIQFSGLSITSPTTFTVSPAKGFIVNDTTNPVIPFLTYVEYSGGTHTATYVTATTETWVYLTSGGTISQSNIPLTDQQRRQNIALGKLGHANKTSIINAFSQPDFVLSPLSQLRDMFEPINLINGGITTSANGANLRFNTSAGYLHGLGINFANDTLNPNSLYVTGTEPCTFQYRTQTGGTTSNTTFIDPTKKDVGGVVTTISGTKATNQRIYLVQNGVFRVQYGQVEYSNLTQAIAGLQNESFVEFSNFTNNGLLVGILSVLSSAIDLTDTSKAQFFTVSKFGDSSGAAGGSPTTNLQQAYDNSVSPEITTNSILGALSVKNGAGTADNITNILEGLNTAGSTTSLIRADGLISGSTIATPSFTANTNGLTATTISATTYQNLPVSGLTAGSNIIITGGSGNFTITASITTGPFGISNSGGTYTYYSSLPQSMSAATTGQTIEMFADVTISSGTAVDLKPGVTIQGNGHTYTHTSTTGNTFNVTTTGTYTFMNINIKRNVTTPGASSYIFACSPGGAFFQAYTLLFQGSYVEYIWSTSTGVTQITGPSANASAMYIDGIRSVANGSGTMFASARIQTLKNSSIENTGTGGCFSSDNITGGSYVENSHLKTNSGTVVTFSYAGQGDSIRNSTVISTSGIGVSGGYAYDTSSFSNTNRSFSGVICYRCAGSTGSGTVYYSSTASNSTGVSSTGYVVVPFFTLSSFFNCTFNAVTNIVAYDTGYAAAFYNCVLSTSYNNAAGHAISLAGSGNVLVNSYVTVANASANCFRGTSAISAKYSNNVFAGATTPVNSNVTQSIVNTQDNQGNILI